MALLDYIDKCGIAFLIHYKVDDGSDLADFIVDDLTPKRPCKTNSNVSSVDSSIRALHYAQTCKEDKLKGQCWTWQEDDSEGEEDKDPKYARLGWTHRKCCVCHITQNFNRDVSKMDPTFKDRDALDLFAKTLEGYYIHIECGKREKIPMLIHHEN